MADLMDRQATNALIETQVGEFLATTSHYEMVDAFAPLATEAEARLLETRGYNLGLTIGNQLSGLRRQAWGQDLSGGIQHGVISLAARSVVGLTYAEGEVTPDYINTFRDSFPQERRLWLFKNPLTAAAEQEISMTATDFIYDLNKAGWMNSAGLVYASVNEARAFKLRDRISNPVPRKVIARAKKL